MVGDFVTAPTRNETKVVRQEADKRSSTTGRTDSSERCDVSKSVSGVLNPQRSTFVRRGKHVSSAPPYSLTIEYRCRRCWSGTTALPEYGVKKGKQQPGTSVCIQLEDMKSAVEAQPLVHGNAKLDGGY
jgi:hypothetical protein